MSGAINGAMSAVTHLSASCPLCASSQVAAYHQDSRREYEQCGQCKLVFVPPAQYLSAAAEKAEYDQHQNRLDDPGYRQFLSRLYTPLQARLLGQDRPGVHLAPLEGLDFGAGPGPLLAQMLREAGYKMAIYDLFYAPDTGVFSRPYDFITATEVVEHLHQPGRELQRLFACLRPGGTLGIMTKLVIDPSAFSRWHYKNDQTHVCFFSQDTFQWLATCWGASLEFVGNDVILLQRPYP